MRDFDWSTTTLGEPAQWPESLKTLVNILLASNQPMYIAWGPQRSLLYNEPYAGLLGPRHPRAMGQALFEVWPEVRDDVLPLVEKVFRGDSVQMDDIELQLRRDGVMQAAHFSFFYSPVRDAQGEVAGLFCACNEITTQVQVQRHLRESEAHYRAEHKRLAALFQEAPGFLAVLHGPQHVMENFNAAYEQLVGHRNLRGLPVAVALPEVVEQGFIALLDQVYTSGEPYRGSSVEVSLNRTPGAPPVQAFVDFVYQPLRDDTGDVYGILVQGHEVTEQHRAQMELRDVARRKDEFLATLAHELRNPLAPVTNAIAILRAPQTRPETHSRMLDLMERQTRHLVRLVDDLMEVSRITSGKIDLRLEQADLRTIAQSCVDAAGSSAQEARHRVRLHLPAHPVWVQADPARLKQVLDNLLNNAIKYTPPGGSIEVEVHAPHGRACITVKDDGVGIPPDMLGRVFDLFAQVDHTIGRARGGLGIGLALVKQLVALHHGDVSVHSAGIGTGATFTVLLPPAPAQLVENGTEANVSFAPTSRPQRVLVIDDNRDAADTLAAAVGLFGHTVEKAYDGPSGLTAAERLKPDCILLDVGMPDMDGHQVARALRANPAHQHCRIVAVTGWGQSADRERTRESGFDAHLVKPASIEELLAVLEA